MKIRKSYQPLLVPGAIILIVVASLLMFFPGQIKSITKERKNIKKLEKENKDLKVKHLLISSLEEAVLVKQSSLALAALPKDKKVPYILKGLRDAVYQSGFVIREFKFSPGEISKDKVVDEELKKKRIEQLPLDFKISGPFSKLVSLIVNLEKATPLFLVESLSLVNSSNSLNSNIEFNLSTFYSPPLAARKTEILELEDLVLDEEETELLEFLSQLNLTVVEQKKSATGDYEKKEGSPFSP